MIQEVEHDELSELMDSIIERLKYANSPKSPEPVEDVARPTLPYED
jgi:hypothetical protein